MGKIKQKKKKKIFTKPLGWVGRPSVDRVKLYPIIFLMLILIPMASAQIIVGTNNPNIPSVEVGKVTGNGSTNYYYTNYYNVTGGEQPWDNDTTHIFPNASYPQSIRGLDEVQLNKDGFISGVKPDGSLIYAFYPYWNDGFGYFATSDNGMYFCNEAYGSCNSMIKQGNLFTNNIQSLSGGSIQVAGVGLDAGTLSANVVFTNAIDTITGINIDVYKNLGISSGYNLTAENICYANGTNCASQVPASPYPYTKVVIANDVYLNMTI